MNNNEEIEAKYRATQPIEPAQLEALVFAPYKLGPRARHELYDRVMDTETLQIIQQGFVLRLRQDGEKMILTLKGPAVVEGEIHRRAEWETVLVGESPTDPATWPTEFQSRLRDLVGTMALSTPLQIRNHRHTWPILRDGIQVGEVALDAGTIQAGEVTLALHEVEVELKGQGSEADLQAIGALFVGRLPLEPEPRSKVERGMALLEKRNEG